MSLPSIQDLVLEEPKTHPQGSGLNLIMLWFDDSLVRFLCKDCNCEFYSDPCGEVNCEPVPDQPSTIRSVCPSCKLNFLQPSGSPPQAPQLPQDERSGLLLGVARIAIRKALDQFARDHKRCGCLSMSGVCHNCRRRGQVEEALVAALEEIGYRDPDTEVNNT